jgi:hypothetical protein
LKLSREGEINFEVIAAGDVNFEVIASVLLKFQIFMDVKSCVLVKNYGPFEGT